MLTRAWVKSLSVPMRESWHTGICVAVLCFLGLARHSDASAGGYDTKQSPPRTCPRARFPARNYVYRVPADRSVPLKTHRYATGILDIQRHSELEITDNLGCANCCMDRVTLLSLI